MLHWVPRHPAPTLLHPGGGGPPRELGLLRIARWACCTVQVVDVGLMAEAMEFCATQDSCRNQAFNLSNGDTFRWSQVCVCCLGFCGCCVFVVGPRWVTLLCAY